MSIAFELAKQARRFFGRSQGVARMRQAPCLRDSILRVGREDVVRPDDRGRQRDRLAKRGDRFVGPTELEQRAMHVRRLAATTAAPYRRTVTKIVRDPQSRATTDSGARGSPSANGAPAFERKRSSSRAH